MSPRANPYGLSKPCGNCPFLQAKPFALGTERREEIAESIREGGEFHCHKTLDYSHEDGPRDRPGTQVCAGSLIVQEKSGEGYGQLTRIAGRLGMFDPDALDLEADVPDSLDEWVEQDPIGRRL